VACRLSAVGANRVQIFDSGAVAQIHRLTKGNPGLINQVCDNALLEAFSRGNKQVTAAEVLAAAHAIVGALHLLSHGTGVSLKLGGPPAAALSPPLSAAPAPHAGPSPVRVLAPAPSKTPAPAPALEPACAPQPAPAAPGGSPQRLARMTRAFDAYVGNVEQRLSFLETRLTTALSAVRNARLEHDGSRSPQTAPAAAPEKTDDAPGGGAVRRGRRLM
jgi:hypothetical protein